VQPDPAQPYPTYTQLRDQLETATSTLLAIGGLVDEWRADGLDLDAAEANRRVRRAAVLLSELLDLPATRPDCWEAAPVESLRDPLSEILTVLQGGES
jgi:hypothetical protein